MSQDSNSTALASAGYVKIGRMDATEDTWRLGTGGAPSPREDHTAVWTGTEMLVWGGYDGTSVLSSGAKYNPATNTWQTLSSAGVVARRGHTAVWSGSRMLIWGGFNGTAVITSGSRYDPVADTWSGMAATNEPVARSNHTAVWTGTVMIVWGGKFGTNLEYTAWTGGRYNPTSDTWASVTTAVPDAAPATRPSGRDRRWWSGEEEEEFRWGLAS